MLLSRAAQALLKTPSPLQRFRHKNRRFTPNTPEEGSDFVRNPYDDGERRFSIGVADAARPNNGGAAPAENAPNPDVNAAAPAAAESNQGAAADDSDDEILMSYIRRTSQVYSPQAPVKQPPTFGSSHFTADDTDWDEMNPDFRDSHLLWADTDGGSDMPPLEDNTADDDDMPGLVRRDDGSDDEDESDDEEQEDLNQLFPKTITYEGVKYYRHHIAVDGSKASYRCYKYREGCRSRLYKTRDGSISVGDTEHGPDCPHNAEVQLQGLVDVTEKMKRICDEQAVTFATSKSAATIALDVLKQIELEHGKTYEGGLTRKQLQARVYAKRNKEHGGFEANRVEAEHMRSGLSSLVRSTCKWIDPKSGENQEIVCFSDPRLLAKMKTKQLQTFVDCTFSVPKKYYQVFVLMIFDEVHDIYLPCYWALMSGKTESCYRMVLRHMHEDLGGKFYPATIGIDFEQGFINAVKAMFPTARLVGCTFHWKQAIRRKLIDLGFPPPVVHWFMQQGNLDLLTVLPPDHVNGPWKQGTVYVAHLLENGEGAPSVRLADGTTVSMHEWCSSEEGRDKITLFWKYMTRQWLKNDMVKIWNHHEFTGDRDDDLQLVARQSGALERNNLAMKQHLGGHHPSLSMYVTNIGGFITKQVTRLDLISTGRDVAPTYQDVPFPRIPSDYEDFEVPSSRIGLDGERRKSPLVPKKKKKKSTASTGLSPMKKIAKMAAPLRKSKRVPKKATVYEV